MIKYIKEYPCGFNQKIKWHVEKEFCFYYYYCAVTSSSSKTALCFSSTDTMEERFLKNHRSEIIQKTREPIALADRLRENNCISDELYNKIQTQRHKEDQMREIYKCLNSRTHFICTYDWLKERESNVLEDLGKLLHFSFFFTPFINNPHLL